MIEKQQYETYTTNEGDDTVYDIRGFDPDVIFEEDVYKVKSKSKSELPEGLEEFMAKIKMKIALITDTHFGARNDNVNFNEYFYQFYEGVFFPYLQQNNIKTCIHLGDCFDRRKYLSYKTAKILEKDLYYHLSIRNRLTYVSR